MTYSWEECEEILALYNQYRRGEHEQVFKKLTTAPGNIFTGVFTVLEREYWLLIEQEEDATVRTKLLGVLNDLWITCAVMKVERKAVMSGVKQ